MVRFAAAERHVQLPFRIRLRQQFAPFGSTAVHRAFTGWRHSSLAVGGHTRRLTDCAHGLSTAAGLHSPVLKPVRTEPHGGCHLASWPAHFSPSRTIVRRTVSNLSALASARGTSRSSCFRLSGLHRAKRRSTAVMRANLSTRRGA